MIEDLLGIDGVPVVAGQDIDQLHAINAEEPATFAEAEQYECWHQAMKEEMKSIRTKSGHLRIFLEGTGQ
jgi:hypothetical protein